MKVREMIGLFLAGGALVLLSVAIPADDTEIYRADFDAADSGRPKVLIVFDDSGSMSFEITQQPAPYDPEGDYNDVFGSERIYWSTDGSVPAAGSNNWFHAGANRCASSYAPLGNVGYFQTGKARRLQGVNSVWRTLNEAYNTPLHVECIVDVINDITDNGPGYSAGYARKDVSGGYSTDPNAGSAINWGSLAYTFYTSHYLNWSVDPTLVTRTRISIAQEVITGIINANPGIDFGLMELNGNRSTNYNGGRVTRRIITEDLTTAERTAAKNTLNTMINELRPAGSTPLCEATYEAYRYLAGASVLWGDNKTPSPNLPAPGSSEFFNIQNSNNDDPQPRDPLAESPAGTYASPTTDCAYTYVILMTDGEPQYDESANTAIETLTGKTCSDYPTPFEAGMFKNCLPELAEYMATTDLDDDATNGDQFGITYTIGFTTDQDLLRDTAEMGGGDYYTANNAQELTDAFRGAIISILSTNTTFTSPSVAVDSFTRTQSREEVFYAMFLPGNQVNWSGNIKKLRLSIEGGEAVLVDVNDTPAIDASTGFIKSDAVTFWSDIEDGGAVEQGGVGGLLAARNPSTRILYSDTGLGGALQAMNTTNMVAEAFGFTADEELYELFDVTDGAGLAQLLNWTRGYEDGNVDNETRDWILGDILHSQPLVLNYGARTDFTQENPDLRLVVGTNAGFVHMFRTDTGQESWAFFPKELAPILGLRFENAVSEDNVYGMDATATAYTLDQNKDGTIDASAGDKAFVYIGMRRGGNSLYALNVSNPDSPSLLWSIGPDDTGFGELGESWSKPVVTRIPGYRDASGAPKPVLVFGAGYDIGKDATGLATPDTMGRGVFIVDAETGALVWSVTPAVNSASNLQESGLQHAVPAEVTVLDSNGDDLTDRIYFADTGGNVWRIDMPGNTLPTASQTAWQINKLAAVNGSTVATDRRFFNAPDVVRIRFDGKPVDAVLIGSGDRSNPNATDVDNRFYMIRDERVVPYFSASPSGSECAAMDPVADFRCLLPFQDSDLYDITADALNVGTDEVRVAALVGLRAANGWRLDLQNGGEKSLARSLTVNGKTYVATFIPNSLENDVNVCEPQSGNGRLYIVDLFDGARSVIPLGPIIPDAPSAQFGSDGRIRLLLPPGTPTGDIDGDGTSDCVGGVCEIGEIFRPPYGTHWFQEDYQ